MSEDLSFTEHTLYRDFPQEKMHIFFSAKITGREGREAMQKGSEH
jgi:hypothetical protein